MWIGCLNVPGPDVYSISSCGWQFSCFVWQISKQILSKYKPGVYYKDAEKNEHCLGNNKAIGCDVTMVLVVSFWCARIICMVWTFWVIVIQWFKNICENIINWKGKKNNVQFLSFRLDVYSSVAKAFLGGQLAHPEGQNEEEIEKNLRKIFKKII